ncbi:MAG: pantetheine-phosphate adenylyltransferase [Nanoarchaeota archaeon]|nr:pantetheine-phosphate adenylyltransferase [Nanoarchaeota archaeon]
MEFQLVDLIFSGMDLFTKMTKAIYAFSGDPITYGHIDIIKRAAHVFEEVIIGIGVNPAKNYTFSLDERTEMARISLQDVSNIIVTPFEGLLVDYAYEQGASVIVKGVRDSKDFDYERTLHHVGDSQNLGIDTHILFARPELAHVSSSAVKEIQNHQGDIHEYVPLYVKQCLEERISGQYLIGVSGEIGAGKSHVSNRFVELGAEYGVNVYNIELDHVAHDILGNLKEPGYETVRENIERTFGRSVRRPDGTIDRKVLGGLVFGEPDKLAKLNELMYSPIQVRFRKALYGKQGLILVNSALLAESDGGYLSNNNVVLVYVDEESQYRRLIERGYSFDQTQRRIHSQYDYKTKYGLLNHVIERDKQGKIWSIQNSDGAPDNNIRAVFETVLAELRVK